jgi:predicted signal transduction protein with EAL and GGDEF domain
MPLATGAGRSHAPHPRTVREDDTVARLGGDEFVVLLVGLQAAEECVGSLQRMLERMASRLPIAAQVLNISASIGVALYPDDEEDAETLLRHADQAMYLAKLAGKNRYHLFDPASDRRARSHHQLLQEIAAWPGPASSSSTSSPRSACPAAAWRAPRP